MSNIRLAHLILTLRSTNELLLENLLDPDAVAELAQEVLTIWQQGINRQGHSRGKWKVEFAGSPWASTGLDAILYVMISLSLVLFLSFTVRSRAGRMINRLYFMLARLVRPCAPTIISCSSLSRRATHTSQQSTLDIPCVSCTPLSSILTLTRPGL